MMHRHVAVEKLILLAALAVTPPNLVRSWAPRTTACIGRLPRHDQHHHHHHHHPVDRLDVDFDFDVDCDARSNSNSNNNNNNKNNSAKSTHDRRHFIRAATTGASAIAATAFSTVVAPREALAANNANSNSSTKYYSPPRHSMDGLLVVITGGNTGLGLESVKRLALAGASVVLTSRSEEKGRGAVAEVEQYLEDKGRDSGDVYFGNVKMATLDLCDLESVKSFPDRLQTIVGKQKQIDVLMNNAGVMAIPDRRITKDGYEQTFQTNHLGHFALTAKLLPLLANKARIVNISSLGYQFAGKGLELDNLNGEKEYGPWTSYGQSKLANILFTNELQQRALAAGRSSLTVYSVHPGAVQTDLARYLIGEEKFNSMKDNGFSSWQDKIAMETLAKFVKTVQDGASTQVYLAYGEDVGLVADQANAGQFFSDLKPQKVKAFAKDKEMAKDLWTLSEKLTGVKFDL